MSASAMQGNDKEEERKKEETTGQKYNVCTCYAGWLLKKTRN